jgi:hypothetical protein
MALCPCLLAATAAAQQADSYLGPGVLSRGVGGIGMRSGQQVDLRFYAGVSGVYDNQLQPVSVDAKGNLNLVKGLYGVEGDLGAYGVHNWKTASLALDYRGLYRHYSEHTYFDGSDHTLALGYTYRKSRRLVFDLRQLAGTYAQGFGVYGVAPSATVDIVNQPTALLFDNRTHYIQSTMDVSYLASARTIYTAGGDGFLVRRQSSALVGVNGYQLRGSVQHRLSRVTTVGATYQHLHFDYPKFFGEADINQAEGFYATQLGRRWTFSLAGGVYIADVVGEQQLALDPAVRDLLGVGFTFQAFSRRVTYPSGDVRLTRQFKTSTITFDYNRTVLPGNGIYLTSRSENGTGTFSYSGIRKWNFSISGGFNSLDSIGQGLSPYHQYSGGAGITYGVSRSVHIVTAYDARHQEILQDFATIAGYRRTGYRATLGLTFSPGDVPLSLW